LKTFSEEKFKRAERVMKILVCVNIFTHT